MSQSLIIRIMAISIVSEVTVKLFKKILRLAFKSHESSPRSKKIISNAITDSLRVRFLDGGMYAIRESKLLPRKLFL